MPQPWELYAQQTAPQANKQPWEQFQQPQPQPYQPDPVRAAYQGVMNNVAKPINNAVSSAVGAVGEQLGKLVTPEGKVAFHKAVDYVSNSPVGVAVKEGATQIGEAYDDLKSYDANGNLAHDLPALGQNAQLAGTLVASKPVVDLARPYYMGALNATEQASQKLPGFVGNNSGVRLEKSAMPSMEEVAKSASNAYKASDQAGGVFNPTFTGKAHDIIESAKFKPIAGNVLLPAEKAVNNYLEGFAGLKGNPITLNEFQRIDSELGDAATQAWVSGKHNEGRIISDVQDKIRDMVKPENLSHTDIVGGREGLDILTKDAIPLWAAKSKMQDIQKIIERANSMDNPTTAMRTGFRNLSLSGKMKSYPMEVQKLIIKARDTGKVDDLLGIVGSRLNPIIHGATGGLTGAIATNATSMAGRGVRNYLKNKQADKIMEALVKPVAGSVSKFSDETLEATKAATPAAQPPKLLTYQPDARPIEVNSSGQAILPQERVVLGRSPSIQNVMRLAAPDTKAAFGEAWDKLSEAQQATINAQMEKMWKSQEVPLEDMILQSKQAVDDLMAATGSEIKNPAMREALLSATREPTLKEIMNMKPKDARAALAKYKSKR